MNPIHLRVARLNLLVAVILVGMLTQCPYKNASAQEIGLRNQTIESELLSVGQGFDSIFGLKRSAAVDFNGDKDLFVPGNATAWSELYTFDKIESFRSLKTALHFSASASLGLGSIFDADVTTEYVKSGKYSEYDEYLYLDIIVQSPPLVLRKPTINATALALYKNNPDLFYRHYGDSYINGYRMGGHMTAIICLHSADSDAHDAVKLKVDASGPFGTGVKTTFAQSLTSLKSIASVTVKLVRGGGDAVDLSIDDLIDAANKFPGSAQKSSRQQYLLLDDYANTDNAPADFNLSDYRRNEKALKRISLYIEEGYELQNKLLYIKENGSQFASQNVDKNLLDVEDKIIDLNDQARRVAASKTEIDAPPPPHYPNIEATRLRVAKHVNQIVVGDLIGEARTLDAARVDDLQIGTVDKGSKFFGIITDKLSMLNANNVIAKNVQINGKVDGQSTIYITAPKGRVVFSRKIDGQSDVHVVAPDGVVEFDEEINGQSTVNITAKTVIFHGNIDGGNKTHVNVTLSAGGLIQASGVYGTLRVERSHPGEPQPQIRYREIKDEGLIDKR